MEGLAGVVAMETKAIALTFNVVEPLIPPDVALIVVEPPLRALDRPAPLMLATEG